MRHDLFLIAACMSRVALVPARVCNLTADVQIAKYGSFSNDGNFLQFSSQDDLDRRLTNCTSVVSDLYFPSSYAGTSVRFSGVQQLLGKLILEDNHIKEFFFGDVTYLKNFYGHDGHDLDTFSCPKLRTVGDIIMTGYVTDGLDFPMLDEVFGALSIDGGVGNFSAPLLRNATYLSIMSFAHHADGFDYSPWEVNLPALEELGGLSLYGEFSSVRLPKLRRVVPSTYRLDGGKLDLDIEPAINISLPSLVTAPNLYIAFDATLHIPQLVEATEIFLEPSTAILPIEAPMLRNVSTIKVFGNFTDVSFPVLEDAWYIALQRAPIFSRLACNRTSALRDWERMNATWVGGSHNPPCPPRAQDCNKENRYFHCNAERGLRFVPTPAESSNAVPPSSPSSMATSRGCGSHVLFAISTSVIGYLFVI